MRRSASLSALLHLLAIGDIHARPGHVAGTTSLVREDPALVLQPAFRPVGTVDPELDVEVAPFASGVVDGLAHAVAILRVDQP